MNVLKDCCVHCLPHAGCSFVISLGPQYCLLITVTLPASAGQSAAQEPAQARRMYPKKLLIETTHGIDYDTSSTDCDAHMNREVKVCDQLGCLSTVRLGTAKMNCSVRLEIRSRIPSGWNRVHGDEHRPSLCVL